MDQATIFERSLLDVTKYATPPQYHPDNIFQDTYTPREPVRGSVPGLQLANNVLRPLDLSQKPMQDFGLRATRWEADWSSLAAQDHDHRFNPIVDNVRSFAGFLVVGHFGVIDGGRILVPSSYQGWSGPLTPALNQGIPAYVVRDMHTWTAGGKWSTFATTEELYTVGTSTDGRILLELAYDTVGLTGEDPVMDLIMILDGVELGGYAVKSVIPKLARKAWGVAVRAFELALRGAEREEFNAGMNLVAKMRASGKRAVVNIGGTGEVADAINVNPNVVAPRVGIPNHIADQAENLGQLFGQDTIDEIISNDLPPNTLDWKQVLPGAQKVLKRGGKITIRFTGVGEDAKVIMDQLSKLGFKDIQNGIRVGQQVIGEGSVITAIR